MVYYTDECKDVDHLSHVDIQQISSFSSWIVEDPIEQEKYVRYTFRIDSVLLGSRSNKREGKNSISCTIRNIQEGQVLWFLSLCIWKFILHQIL